MAGAWTFEYDVWLNTSGKFVDGEKPYVTLKSENVLDTVEVYRRADTLCQSNLKVVKIVKRVVVSVELTRPEEIK